MERHFDEALAGVKHKLLRMGGLAEEMIRAAVKALVDGQAGLLARVDELEPQVNRLQIEIDEEVLYLIALHQPTASDLRFLLGVSKINTELERLGDEAVNIGDVVRQLLREPPILQLVIIPEMARLATDMVNESLHAFVRQDPERARQVLFRDDTVDDLCDQVEEKCGATMRQDPETMARGLSLIIVAKKLERMADHATNIAEDVIFVVEGKDIRHHAADGGILPNAAEPRAAGGHSR